MPIVQPYVYERDHAALAPLWRNALGARWPLTDEEFRQSLPKEPGAGEVRFVARTDDDRLLGFVAAQAHRRVAGEPVRGAIRALLVAPAAQRQGIGTALHDRVLAALHEHGVRDVGAGGGSPRLWPGIPTDLPAALTFFEARGWDLTEQSHDLIRDLYQDRDGSAIPLLSMGIAISTAQDTDLAAVLAFERHEFPSWHDAYATLARHGRHDDILIARHEGTIVGTLIAFGPNPQPEPDNVIWAGLLSANCGGLGAVGVAAAARRRGIGAVLVARGTALLRERGVRISVIGWTWLPEFYEQHGYQLWRSYAMGCRRI